jgi:C_GCAxxG_C_C family probable redox protein
MCKLKRLLEDGFGQLNSYTADEKLSFGNVNMNCCERILYGSNIVYELGLSNNNMRLAAGFGGGMGIGSMCGAISGAVMVLGLLFSGPLEKSTNFKQNIIIPFLNYTKRIQGGLSCTYNKKRYASYNPFDCSSVILAIAESLDTHIKHIQQNH